VHFVNKNRFLIRKERIRSALPFHLAFVWMSRFVVSMDIVVLFIFKRST
jgi:hypothetical protein